MLYRTNNLSYLLFFITKKILNPFKNNEINKLDVLKFCYLKNEKLSEN